MNVTGTENSTSIKFDLHELYYTSLNLISNFKHIHKQLLILLHSRKLQRFMSILKHILTTTVRFMMNAFFYLQTFVIVNVKSYNILTSSCLKA